MRNEILNQTMALSPAAPIQFPVPWLYSMTYRKSRAAPKTSSDTKSPCNATLQGPW